MILFYTIGITITLLACFEKWGWLDWYESIRKTWMPKGNCFLCLSFWLSMPVTALVYFAFMFQFHFFLVPLAVAGIVNLLCNEKY